MKVLLATGNTHKKEEFKRIFKSHEILIPADIGIDFDVDEIGATFLENSLIKARALLQTVRDVPILADDSGLSIPAFGGAPGIYSARYGNASAGSPLTSTERNECLLQDISHLKGEERYAFFVCCLTLMLDEHRFFTSQEILSGFITHSPCGTGGFGYDPIFYLPGRDCSVAELSEEDKDVLSHRGQAARRLQRIMDSLEAD